MSFLNPVSEPVLRFSSTDADAPQINYNARVAGDVKTVLKACLVTGYGAVASAGWSIVNEVNHIAEFVSPSAAMSDYRLGIDDTSTSSTTWYYQYQNLRTNPSLNAPTRTLRFIDAVNVNNGWRLFVTDRGILFVELVYFTTVSKLSARITYLGQVKSGLSSVSGKNIMFFNLGHDASITYPRDFYNSSSAIHMNLDGYTSVYTSAATARASLNAGYVLDVSNIDLVSEIYLSNNNGDILIGFLPPLLGNIVNKTSDLYGANEVVLDGRNYLRVCAAWAASASATALPYSRTFLIPLDYWSY